jgi:hypothetical protein
MLPRQVYTSQHEGDANDRNYGTTPMYRLPGLTKCETSPKKGNPICTAAAPPPLSVAVISAATTRAAAIPAVLRQPPHVARKAGHTVDALLSEEPLPLGVLCGRRRDQRSRIKSRFLAVRRADVQRTQSLVGVRRLDGQRPPQLVLGHGSERRHQVICVVLRQRLPLPQSVLVRIEFCKRLHTTVLKENGA